jgi:hypothetical protein
MSGSRAVCAVMVVWACAHPTVALASGPGIMGGLTRATFATDGWSRSTGFGAGLFATIATVKGVAVRPEIAFVRKTPERQLGEGDAAITTRVAVDYVELPVLLRYSLLPGRRLTPVLFAGLFAAVRTKARAHTDIGEASFDEDLTDSVKRWDSGFVGGVGLELRSGRVTWVADVRYAQGFPSVGQAHATGTWKTRTLAAMAGVQWSR